MKEYFISEIDIEKLYHLSDIKIKLDSNKRQHLLLTGKNGSGKTSLLLEIEKFLRAINDEKLSQVFDQYPTWINEAKKKVLTIKSKSEQNYNIFMDLSTSLLKSQIQAGKVEFLLKKNGKIILKENKREHEILLGGQNNKKDFLNTIRILFFT